MIDKRRAYHLVGETLRDIGILIFVFAPLDAFFQREPPDLLALAVAVAGALLFISTGIIIEAGE